MTNEQAKDVAVALAAVEALPGYPARAAAFTARAAAEAPYHYVAGGMCAASPGWTPEALAQQVTDYAEALLRDWFIALRGATRAYHEFPMPDGAIHRVVFHPLNWTALTSKHGSYDACAVALQTAARATLHMLWLTSASAEHDIDVAREDGHQPVLIVRRDPRCEVEDNDPSFDTGNIVSTLPRQQGLKLTMRLGAWEHRVNKALQDVSTGFSPQEV